MLKKIILVAMVTKRIATFCIFLHFFAFLLSNGGDRSMIIGHVAYQNDRLGKTYQKQKKKC
jgi:hypothetical protein